jgi:hypothetical protein
MNTMTWTDAPADLLGLGGSDVRRCTDRDSRLLIGVRPAPRVAPFEGTGVPAGGIAGRLRPVVLQASTPAGSQGGNQGGVKAPVAPYAHNSISTTLGIHPSGRPMS